MNFHKIVESELLKAYNFSSALVHQVPGDFDRRQVRIAIWDLESQEEYNWVIDTDCPALADNLVNSFGEDQIEILVDEMKEEINARQDTKIRRRNTVAGE